MPATRKRVSAADFEKDVTEVSAFTVDTLSPAEREHANRAADVAKALLLKALLHRLSPGEFAVSADADSAEAKAVRAVSGLHPVFFNRLAPRLRAVHADRASLTTHFGTMAANLDLTRPVGNALALPKIVVRPTAEPTPPPVTLKLQPPKWGRAFFNLRVLHCVDETDPEGGADDMVLGGIMVGPDGVAHAIKSIVAGSFDDGDVQDYGSLPLGSVSLAGSPGYPKNVYCIITLVESDQDDRDAADALSSICDLAAGTATLAGGFIPAAVFKAASEMFGILSMCLDDDEFPPYGIELRLGSAMELGRDGVDINRRTSGIRAHGGVYRVGFRWELVA